LTVTPQLRIARPEEISTMLDWAAAEGWNPGLDDAAPFRAADPAGFFVAEVDGAPAAAISVVNHADTLAFLGLYICHPDFRSRGIGMALWTHALAHAGDRTVGLDGVAAQQANYAKFGFVLAGASRRFAGSLPGRRDDDVRLAGPGDADRIARLDSAANGYARPAFLGAWTARGKTRVTVIGETGFATIRRCREGCKIGPIVARDDAAALTLAEAAVAELPAGTVIVDAAPGSTLAAPLRARGFQETFATARMYRGTPPQGDGTLRALATMELG